MRRTRTLLVAPMLVAVALAGCSQESDAPGAPSVPAAPTGTGTADPEVDPAQEVVEAFYTALGQRDCFTMRTLAALSYQQDDDYWADGCIDDLQLTVGDNYDYTVLSGLIDGQEADFRVQRELPDGSSVVDEVVLIDVTGWQVESRTPFDG